IAGYTVRIDRYGKMIRCLVAWVFFFFKQKTAYEIELARGDALSIPWQIEVERAPFQRQIGILLCQVALTAPPEECVRLCDEVAFYLRQEPAFVKPTHQDFTGAAGAGAEF